MNFGSQTTFDYVRNMISNPNSEAEYANLYNIVWTDCSSLLARVNLPKEDKEDIIQDVQMSLFPRLHWYVEKFADASVAQRNACLKTILDRRLNDLLARKYKHKGVSSYDVDDFPMDLYGVPDTMLLDISNRDEVQQVLRMVCAMDLPPQNIIAFLATKSTALFTKGGKNGKPAQVAQMLNGLTLQEAAQVAVQQMTDACPFPLPQDVFVPLFLKISQAMDSDEAWEEIFDLTPRAISNACSQISEKLRKLWDRLIGGNIL